MSASLARSTALGTAATPSTVLFHRLAERTEHPPRRTLRLVPRPTDPAARAAPSAPPPPTLVELRRLLSAVVDVLNGRRQASQLDAVLPMHAQKALLRSESANRSSRCGRRLRSVHASLVRPGALELCATVDQGTRARAMVARMEPRRGRWQFTTLTLL
ncbi:MAG TPA: Rv3235 family protein [Pseudonocardiaceae bacterium]|jgi:hypothetical protein|nr:Rv3235 family protein [Pseudonocardiaceae bacterium]